MPERRPPGPPGLFGLRNIARFAPDTLGFLTGLRDRYGDVAELRIAGRRFVLVSHPDDIESVLVKHARSMQRDAFVEVVRRVLGLGLLTSEGELWKRQRKLMSQAFVPRRIHAYGDAMARVTEAALARLRDGAVINLHAEVSRLTMEVVADVLFGASVDAADVETVRGSLEAINELLANSPEVILRLPAWLPTPRNLRANAAVARLDAIVQRVIDRRRAGEQRDDLLGTLLAAQDDDGTRMSDRQLRDEVLTLFLAGHETTALALAHALYLLAQDPGADARLADEARAVLGDRLPTADDVRALVYADRVVKEAMRLYPPAWTTGREVTEEVEIAGYRMPVGTQILTSQWVVHRDPRWFPDPGRFDPDRFAPERARELPRFAYFPFGGGPRVCIGNHFAMLEATLLLAMIVRRFRVELLPGQTLALRPSITLRQRGPGLLARVASRAA